MTADMTVRVSCKYKDGEWQAVSPVYKILVIGCGDTPEDAIEDYVAQLRRYYEGRVFEVAYGMPFDLSYQITGMSAEVSLNVRREASLSSFGIDVCQGADDNPQASLEGDAPLQLAANERGDGDYLDEVVATVEQMQRRDPVVDPLFKSGYTAEDKDAFERKMVEQDLRRIRCEDCINHQYVSQNGNSRGLSCSLLGRPAVDITDAECPDHVAWDNNDTIELQTSALTVNLRQDVDEAEEEYDGYVKSTECPHMEHNTEMINGILCLASTCRIYRDGSTLCNSISLMDCMRARRAWDADPDNHPIELHTSAPAVELQQDDERKRRCEFCDGMHVAYRYVRDIGQVGTYWCRYYSKHHHKEMRCVDISDGECPMMSEIDRCTNCQECQCEDVEHAGGYSTYHTHVMHCSVLGLPCMEITDTKCPILLQQTDPTSMEIDETAKSRNTWALTVSNDVINGMYIVANSRNPVNYVILPNSGGMSKVGGIASGDRVILYETVAKKGRKAYVGECVIEELYHVPRDKVCSAEWHWRLSPLYQDIAGSIGSGCSDVRIVQVVGLKLYMDPYPVPQGSSIPHGLVGLTGHELGKIFDCDLPEA